MVLYQLRKEYAGSGGGAPYVAVDAMSIAIDRNECFGLLGPNGIYTAEREGGGRERTLVILTHLSQATFTV